MLLTVDLNGRNTTVSAIVSDGAFTKPGVVQLFVGLHFISEMKFIY